MGYNKQKDKQDPAVTKQIANFLFEKPQVGEKETGEFMDMRTDINTKEMFNALVFYRVLGEHFQCKAATKVANILERLSVANNRGGRNEAVVGLLQKLQSPRFLGAGMDELVSALEKEMGGEETEHR